MPRRRGLGKGGATVVAAGGTRPPTPGAAPAAPARAGVVAAGDRHLERVLAPGDVDRLPQRFALADVEGGRERDPLGSGEGSFDLDHGVEPLPGDRERRVVEPDPGEGNRPRKRPGLPRSGRAAGRERGGGPAAGGPAR